MSSRQISAEERLGILSEDKSQLLKLLLEERSRESQKIPRLLRAQQPAPVRVPTSWAQQRLWFLDQLEGRSEAYHIAVTLRLKGDLNKDALKNALDALVRRHESLRTVFVSVDGDPHQEIVDEATFKLTALDLGAYEASERAAQVLLHRLEEVRTRFDLRTGPLIRGRLLRVASDEHVLLITMHHIISDGWSMGVLTREVAQLYGAYLHDEQNPLQPLPIQYADYAQWQRKWLQGAVREKQLAYWCERLKGAPAQMELPTDHPRPAIQSYRGENLQLALDRELTSDLKALAKQHDLTLFMLLCAGWAILLSRLSGVEDIVVGTPVANRQQAELEALIGFFVNTLPLRVIVSKDFGLEQFLRHVKEVTLSAYEHQDIPFEQVVEALQPERSLSRNPIFQVMLALQSAPRTELRLPDVTVTVDQELYESSMFDLMLSLEERDGQITGTWNYAIDLFDRATMQRWIAGFAVLLREMVRDSKQCIGDLPVMTPEERRTVTVSFNATQEDYPSEKLVHQLFEEQVTRTPAAVAAKHEDATLTYAELDHRASQLARYLRRRGVGADQAVAVCLPRCLDMVVSLLGILKAGGAYLPLDPNYPTERLQQMLEDASPRLVLTHKALESLVPTTGAEHVVLDADWATINEGDANDLTPVDLGLTPGNVVYVIYTSGSTGRPKGTAMLHRAMVNLIEWHRRSPAAESRRVLQFAALSFDVAFQEIFTTLCTGGTLVLLDEWIRKDTRALADFLRNHDIERLFVPPLMLQSLAEHQLAANSPGDRLQHVICAGEQLRITPEIVDYFRQRPGCQLHNHYGPTETHVVTAFTMSGHPGDWPALPPIGRPISNAQIYVLDDRRNPVSIGVVGEIYIGGAGVARGYWHRSDLTNERFLRDPFSCDPHSRMYRTGDLGLWQADGTLKYLGRNDDQVKIRGFRVELGEIEASLAIHEQVKEVAVVAREDIPGERRLVAYVTTRGECAPAVEELREHLKALLPDHMVPSAFVKLESLPLTPSGKLNRRALPAPQLDAYASRQYQAPQGEVEGLVANIWCALLHVERVGRSDNFFELGGHSLLMVQMMERLRQRGLSVDVRSIYQSPILSELARTVVQRSESEIEVPPNLIPPDCDAIKPEMLTLVALEPEHIARIVQTVPGGAANVQDIYPLTPLQEGMLFLHLLNQQGGDTYVLPMLLSVTSRERLEQFIAALQQVVDRHDILRTAILWDQLPQPVQVVCRRVTLPVQELVLDPARASLEQLKECMALERQRMDLRRAPLMNLQIAADRQGDRWYVLLQLHHVVCDHESLDVTIAEVIAYLAEQPSQLPRPMPYRTHVAQALAHAREHDAEAFFRSKLADVTEPTAPFGLLDIQADGSQLARAKEILEPHLSHRLRTQAQRLAVSAATLFHAAWAMVVSRTTGRDDVIFGSVLLGRLQGSAGAQRILGMFINTLPLRIRLKDVSVKELVDQTQRELIDLLNHEQASLAVAQRCSGIPGSTPVFGTLLNYRHSAADIEAEFAAAPGVEFVEMQSWTNYPIMLSVDEQGDKFVLEMDSDRRVDPCRMTAYMRVALQSLVGALEGAPATRALDLHIIPERERHQIITLFNDTWCAFPREKLVHQLFEEQVQRTPNRTAVEREGKSWTYFELNGRANQLAYQLQERGVAHDDVVAICAERSLEMVAALLGVLKAGGAYLPLDPNYPAERLQHMLQDAAPKVLLTQSKLTKLLSASTTAVLELESTLDASGTYSSANPVAAGHELGPQHLVYVIYTSGSTGRPKGTAMPHRSMVNLIEWHKRNLPLDEGRRVLQFAALSFDVAFQEIFSTLCTGATLVLIDEWLRRDVRALTEFLSSQAINRLFVPPLMLQGLAE